MSSIGNRIKTRRKELGITVDDLCERLGKNRATIYRYENGDIQNMPIDIINPIAKALYTTPSYLMGWEETNIGINNIIKDRRLSLKLTMKDVADAVGVSEATVSRWESGNIANMRRDKIAKLAKVLQISPDVIMGFEAESPKSVCPLPPNIITPAAVPVPILGTICAGTGIVPEESFTGFFYVDRSIQADYCLFVSGDSMTGDGIYDGDIAFLRKDFDFTDGKIYAVVFGVDEEASLKHVTRSDDKIILSPSNPSYSPVVEEDCDVFIIGELVGHYHDDE